MSVVDDLPSYYRWPGSRIVLNLVKSNATFMATVHDEPGPILQSQSTTSCHVAFGVQPSASKTKEQKYKLTLYTLLVRLASSTTFQEVDCVFDRGSRLTSFLRAGGVHIISSTMPNLSAKLITSQKCHANELNETVIPHTYTIPLLLIWELAGTKRG